MASSEIACDASLRNYIYRSSSRQLRACSDVLSDALSGEGHISHCNQVFCKPQFGRILLNISPPPSVLDLKTSGKSVRFDLPNYLSLITIATECEL